MIYSLFTPNYVNRANQDWLANGGVYGNGGVHFVNASVNPFEQTDATLGLNFIGSNYTIWETPVGLVTKSFSDIITFTRASSATYFDSAGVLQTATTNTPRFDYNPSTLAARGLLIEESRTNLLLHNQDLTNIAWVATNITAAKNQTGIDGTANSASLITATSSNGTILQAVTSASSARSTSAYVKRIAGTGTIEMTQNGGATWAAVTVTSAWARVNIASATVANPSVGFRIVTSGDAIAVDGVQLENGAFSTSVIPTTTAAVTRSADLASVNTLSPWFNATEGTLFAEGTVVNNIAGTTARNLGYFSDAGVTNVFSVEVRSSTSVRARILTGGVTVSASDSVDVLGVNAKVAGAYAADGATICVNGGSPVTLASSLPSGLTKLSLGQNSVPTAASTINGYLRRITYYPRRLSNAELQTITA